MRKKLLAAALIAIFLASSSAFAAEGGANLSQWIKSTGAKLHSKQKEKKKEAATAGIKGASEKAEDTLYWKDQSSGVKDEEIKSLDAAIELIKAGKSAEAAAALENFLKTFPASPLKADAEEGLALLKTQK